MRDSKKKGKKKNVKIALLIIETTLIIMALIICGFGIYYTTASDETKISMRNGLIKELSGCSLVRNILLSSEKSDYDDNVKDKDFDEEKVDINENVKKKLTGYTNIALFGLDARDGEFEKDTHSDSILIVSINNDTGNVKLVSLYRDTMLKIRKRNGESKYGKANQAFFLGGAEGAVSMLNTNLDLDISDYVVVNFSGLTEIIDALGGIDVNITDEEQFYINGYLVETRKVTGMDSEDVAHSGNVHLNGLQATAYCRIRYTSFFDEEGNEYREDMGRTARQRHVLMKLADKAKAAGSDRLIKIARMILNSNTEEETFVKTSMDFDEIMDIIPIAIDFTLSDTTGFPFTLAMPDINGESMVVAEGLSYNVEKLHKYLFENEDYNVSPEVDKISDYIIDNTGVKEVRLPEDLEEESTEEPTDY